MRQNKRVKSSKEQKKIRNIFRLIMPLILIIFFNVLLLETNRSLSERYSINIIEPPWNRTICDGGCIGNRIELMQIDWGASSQSYFYIIANLKYCAIISLIIFLIWKVLYLKSINKKTLILEFLAVFMLQLVILIGLYIPHIILIFLFA